jgi:hypothetical protein
MFGSKRNYWTLSVTHPPHDQTLQSWTSEPEAELQAQAPAPDDLESASQFRAAFGGRSRQWEHRKGESDPDFPKVIFIGSRRFYRVVDRIEYVRKLEERSAARAAAKAAKKARERELADAADTDND